MADNLRQLTQQVDFAVPINAGIASVKTVNHNPLEKDIISKVGKYTGFPFTATGGYHNGNPLKGYFYWNNNVSNSVNPYTITFSSYTADTNYIGNLLNKFRIDDFLHYKDFAGRSCFVKILGVDVRIDGFGNYYCDLLVQGNNLDNSFVLGSTEFATCMIDIIHNIVDQVDVTGFLTDVDYDNTNHVATFKRYNMPDYVIDFPIEFLISNIDVVGNDLVITFEDGTTKVVPLNTLLVGVVKEVNGVQPDSLGRVYLSITDIPGLQNALNGKADLVHTHTISQIGNLQNVLDGKADVRLSNIVSNLTPAEQTAIKSKLGILDTDTVTRIGTNASNINSGDFILEGVNQTTTTLVGNKIYIETNIDLSPFANKDGSNATGILNDAIVKRHDAVTLGPNSTGLNLAGQVLQFANGYQMPTANEIADWNSLVGNIGNYALRNGSNITNPNNWRTNLDVYSTIQVDAFLNGKQNKLTAGANIQISPTDVISATDTTYSSSNGIQEIGNNFSPVYGTSAGTIAQGNDSRFHNPVTIGTSNGLSLVNQVLSMALAGALSTGTLSSTDWNAFNNKVSANNGNITYVGTGNITGGGTSSANQSGNTNYSFDLTAQTKTDIGLGVSAYNSLGNYQLLLSNGLHTIVSGNQVNVSFDVNTYVKDKSNNDRLLFGNTQLTDVIIKGAVANGDFKVKDSTDTDLFRINGSNKVAYFPQLPAPQTGDAYLAMFDAGNGLWKHSTRISDLVTTSVLNAGLATKANTVGNNLTNIPQWKSSLGFLDSSDLIGYATETWTDLNFARKTGNYQGLTVGNSTQWNGQNYSGNSITPNWFMVTDALGNPWGIADSDEILTALGIGAINASLINKANVNGNNLTNITDWRTNLGVYSTTQVDGFLAGKANTSGNYQGLIVGNSTLWNNNEYIGIELTTSPYYLMGFDISAGGWKPTTRNGVLSWLNLQNDYAYRDSSNILNPVLWRTNLDVYSQNDVNVLLAGKANTSGYYSGLQVGLADYANNWGNGSNNGFGGVSLAGGIDYFYGYNSSQGKGYLLLPNEFKTALGIQNGITIFPGGTSNGSGVGNNNGFINQVRFDYDWAGTSVAGSGISFGGFGGGYQTEIFAQYGSGGNIIGFRTRNDDINQWNPAKLLWHDGNFDPDSKANVFGSNLQNILNWQSVLGITGLGTNKANIDGTNLTNIAGWKTTLNTAEWGEYDGSVIAVQGLYGMIYDNSVNKWRPADNVLYKQWLDLSAYALNSSLANYALLSQIPTNNNQLANGANYTTLPIVQSWIGNQGFFQFPSGGNAGQYLNGLGALVNFPNIPTQLVYTGSNGINVTGTVISPTYGTTAGTIAQGNDSRINNGQTAFGWGNHAGLYPLLSGSYVDPAWIASLDYSKIGNAPTVGQGILSFSSPTGLVITGTFNANQSNDTTIPITYATGYQGFTTAESNKLAGIQSGATVPNNGVFTVQGINALTGGASTSADTALNTTAQLDLAPQTKVDIQKGVDANNTLPSLIDRVRFHNVNSTLSYNVAVTTKKTIVNITTGVLGGTITVEDGLYEGYELAINGCGEFSIEVKGNIVDKCGSGQSITITGDSCLFWWDGAMWIQAI